MHKTIFLLLIGVAAVSAIVCPKNYCATVNCPNVSCSENQLYKERGSFCGCCPVCLHVLKKGEPCGSLFEMGVPPKVVCDKGLRCSPDTQTCE
ncbi:u35-Nephitoxin-Nsp1a_1 [Nephila pilipes]|uniref:U35-Nephitoxin-Nsp1a_1 n=1 Tax=Nephila pilipes TaxID=299642 RepID=A0A8X6TDR4_NEPPI|nr:u35-Nephitoxin-Nsp1a_1 [Nephila pilipes]